MTRGEKDCERGGKDREKSEDRKRRGRQREEKQIRETDREERKTQKGAKGEKGEKAERGEMDREMCGLRVFSLPVALELLYTFKLR
eukprot:493086-Amorphochlora_amoeboformis.AAC.1